MKYAAFLVVLVSLISCGGCQPETQKKVLSQQEIDERLIEVNKQLVKDDRLLIEKFIQEKGWPMERTGTGMRYWIYEEGEDSTIAKSGMTASVSFQISLLDGTPAYGTEEGEQRDFVIDHADVEAGIHEVILLMTPGDRAKVILPPHLAYGLTGDLAKVPLQASLVYDMNLIALK